MKTRLITISSWRLFLPVFIKPLLKGQDFSALPARR